MGVTVNSAPRIGMNKTRKSSRLFDDSPRGRPRTPGTGYGTAARARKTIRLMRGKPLPYAKQVINTMYNRAKYHKYQNQGMREAMRVFRDWLATHR